MSCDPAALREELEEVLGIPLDLDEDGSLPDIGGAPLTCFRGELDGAACRLAVEVIEGPVRGVPRIQERARQVREGSPDRIYVLASSYLTSDGRSRLRASKVNYVDSSGHAWIRAPGIVIRIHTEDESPRVVRRNDAGPSPFAKKASYVVRLMLEHPGRAWGVRELKRALPLSVGHVSNVLREAERRGYAVKEGGRFTLANPERLLAHWSAAYSWEDNEIYSFQVPYAQEEIESALEPVLEREGIRSAVTLLAGSDRLARTVLHDQMHLYVEESGLEPVLTHLQSGLQAESVGQGGNVHILGPYYRGATFLGTQETELIPVVSDVQLFIDLARYPLRGPEAARKLLRDRLGPRLVLSHEAVEWLAAFIEEL